MHIFPPGAQDYNFRPFVSLKFQNASLQTKQCLVIYNSIRKPAKTNASNVLDFR